MQWTEAKTRIEERCTRCGTLSKYVKKNERELERKGKNNLITQVSNDKMKAQRRQRKKVIRRKKHETAEKADRLNECTHTHSFPHDNSFYFTCIQSQLVFHNWNFHPRLSHTLLLTSVCLSRLANMQQLIAFVGRGFVFGQVLLPQAISQSVVAYA